MINSTSGYEFRCNCHHHPLLATYGREEGGDLYVHIRVYKGKKVYAEIYAKHDIRVRCRECTRWHNIIIRNGQKPKMLPGLIPKAIASTTPQPQCLRPSTTTT